MTNSRTIGIDLGTTNSLVAIVREGCATCLPGDDGSTMVPSVVHYGADGAIVVGRKAREELAPVHPTDTIASAKRLMGRGSKDADAKRLLSSYRFAPEEGPIARLVVVQGTRVVTPMEVSAEILRVLKARAEAALDGPL